MDTVGLYYVPFPIVFRFRMLLAKSSIRSVDALSSTTKLLSDDYKEGLDSIIT